MAHRRSKTTVPCDCQWFEIAMADAASPIRFDTELNEYRLVFANANGEEHRYLLYHCPFCGGATPTSKRSEWFLRPSTEELERLSALVDPLTTIEQILQTLGVPEKDETAPDDNTVRWLTYSHLSETALVEFQISDSGGVEVIFCGKYIGPPQ